MLRNYKMVLFIMVILSISFIGCSERGGIFTNKKEDAIRGIDLIAGRLNQYFEKNGEYPEDIYQLKEEGFLSAFPFNPYVEGNKAMIKVKVSAPSTGDFSYLKIYRDSDSDEIMYYVLILWGPSGHENKDVLDANFDYGNFKFTTWDDKPDGKPDRYLKIIKSELQLKPASAEEE